MSDLAARLARRAAAVGIEFPADLANALLAYLELLARWNRRINLTAFDLVAPTDEALDRLVIEPLQAAALVRPDDRRALDIGSGGGSPAVPLTLAAPWLEMTMVEVRVKKAAFLREVARTLPVALRVECARVEDLAASDSAGRFDLITFRAVRADKDLWSAIEALLAPGGRVFWFSDEQEIESGLLIESRRVGPVVIVERR